MCLTWHDSYHVSLCGIKLKKKKKKRSQERKPYRLIVTDSQLKQTIAMETVQENQINHNIRENEFLLIKLSSLGEMKRKSKKWEKIHRGKWINGKSHIN